jgi:hypothetical protein
MTIIRQTNMPMNIIRRKGEGRRGCCSLGTGMRRKLGEKGSGAVRGGAVVGIRGLNGWAWGTFFLQMNWLRSWQLSAVLMRFSLGRNSAQGPLFGKKFPSFMSYQKKSFLWLRIT